MSESWVIDDPMFKVIVSDPDVPIYTTKYEDRRSNQNIQQYYHRKPERFQSTVERFQSRVEQLQSRVELLKRDNLIRGKSRFVYDFALQPSEYQPKIYTNNNYLSRYFPPSFK